MHPIVRDDRIWFQSNPSAVVRFRRAVAGEFQAVLDQGGDAPIFRPSFCRSEAPTRWVAVVDLMRLIEPGDGNLMNRRHAYASGSPHCAARSRRRAEQS